MSLCAKLLFPLALFFISPQPAVSAASDIRPSSISEAAAKRCTKKFKKIEDFAARNEKGKNQTVRITEEEINSYLTLDKSAVRFACVKNPALSFDEDALAGFASIDFDCLKDAVSKSFPRLIAMLLSGSHDVRARGKLESGNGEGILQLEQTRFDDSTIPNFLVEETLALVCRNQKSPCNPLETWTLPHAIKKITVHRGYIVLYQ